MNGVINWHAVTATIGIIVMILTLCGFLVGRWTSASGRVRTTTLNEAAIARLTDLATVNEGRWKEHLQWGENRMDEVRSMERTLAVGATQIAQLTTNVDKLAAVVERVNGRVERIERDLMRHISDGRGKT